MIGALGAVLGAVGGYLVIVWIFTSMIPDTLPELGIEPYLAPTTAISLVALGVLAVAVAPVLTVRRLKHIGVSATLRVVE